MENTENKKTTSAGSESATKKVVKKTTTAAKTATKSSSAGKSTGARKPQKRKMSLSDSIHEALLKKGREAEEKRLAAEKKKAEAEEAIRAEEEKKAAEEAAALAAVEAEKKAAEEKAAAEKAEAEAASKAAEEAKKKASEKKAEKKTEKKVEKKAAEDKPARKPKKTEATDNKTEKRVRPAKKDEAPVQPEEKPAKKDKEKAKTEEVQRISKKKKKEEDEAAILEREAKRKQQEKAAKANARKAKSQRNGKAETPKPQTKQQSKKEEDTIKTITIPEEISLRDLADKIKIPVNQLIKKLFMEGKMYTVNTLLNYEEAAEVAMEYNFIADEEEKIDPVEEVMKDTEDAEEDMVSRPPVVCVMGHVDHGKTSLLDAIRSTSVTSGEAGGITQAIGASVVKAGDREITFLDTPGHEAFTAMRMRGAQSTDIAILVVAADDGVMPQTIEAINHAKAADIQIIVAVNKIDKPAANVERVKQELTEYGLVAEDWGGETIFCPVSAKTGEGIDNLLDMVLLTADMLELKANPNRKARGLVIEARLDKGRGPVATLLVQKGTLKVGEFIAIGEAHGRVRALTNDKHKNVKEELPSTPVEVIGLDKVPAAGDIFVACANEKEAAKISDAYVERAKDKLISSTKSHVTLDALFDEMHAGTLKDLNLIIKADVQGSVEALKQSLLKLSNEEVVVKCIHSGVGAITESDVTLAAASNAIIIGFNIRPDAQAKSLADQQKVDIRQYRVIYNVIDDIEAAMKGMLDPIFEEKVIGHAEVRKTFKASQIGIIAGSFILDGSIERDSKARITRGNDLIFEGNVASLKRLKDDVKEVKAGYECGIVFEGFTDIREGDMIEAYKMVEIPR